MHKMEAHVRYMTLGGLDFESNGKDYFMTMYVIVVEIMKVIRHYMLLHLWL